MESSNVIFSKTRDENYLAYLFIELILVFVITSVGTGLLIFFSVGRADSQRNTNNIEFLFENPFIYVLICLTAAIIAMGLILHFRNRNYIVGYAFNNETLSLRLSYRGLLKKDIKSIEIPYSELLWRSEEHTSELQSRPHFVCCLLLEKKKRISATSRTITSIYKPISRACATAHSPRFRSGSSMCWIPIGITTAGTSGPCRSSSPSSSG